MNPITNNVLLATVFFVYFSAAFVWPTLRVWRLTSRNPYVLPSSDDVPGFVSKAMKAVMLGLFAFIVAQVAWPDAAPALGSLPWLVHPAARIAGWSGLAFAVALTVLAQYQMGLSWRIGIDTAHATELVTAGLFAWSRNPVFLAMRLCLFSLVLLRPNAVTLAIWLAAEVLMQVQVRLEEAFLRALHGAAYDAYCASTRRWM